MDVNNDALRAQSTLNMDHAHATDSVNNVSNTKSPSATNSPLSSTPVTPNLHTANISRRPSHAATSPIMPGSPNPAKNVRRASSAMSMTQRPSSSPGLKKKSSRTSLGGGPEDNEKRPTPKRSISNLITGLREAHSKMESIEEPIPLTAPQIAVEHFARELIAHSKAEAESEVAVILHDACYGHRYSRLKTTKSTLSMIVERPERIRASVLGAATAYVRLGGHHAGGGNAPHPDLTVAAPPPFKVRRTGRMLDITSTYVTNVHGTAWMTELKGMCDVAGARIAAGAKELERTATSTEPEKPKLHEGDLYLSPESLNAFQGALGGVADAVDAVFSPTHTQRAFVAVRPPGHHCSADHPSGFCWLNNVHVGIEYAAQTYGLTHAAILDFDLHHGDGSQAITWQRNSKNNEKRLNAKPNSKLKLGPDIGYYSLHDINSYPCEMGDDDKVQAASLCIDNAHGQSIWNVHLEEWKTIDEFWQLYEMKYGVLLQKTRKFLKLHTTRLRKEGKVLPKSAIFISAGFDASEWEGAGMQRHKVNVPTEFYARFTRDVVELAIEEGLGCEGRVISVLEGGYSDRALCSGVLSHLSGLCATRRDVVKTESAPEVALDQMMRGLGINGSTPATHLQYDSAWWSAENLTALELKVNPPPPAAAKKMRVGQQPTYATPTESFAYKVVDTDKFARSISGTMRDVARPARPPTPPAPEVDWVVATQELSKLLIPTDRQTRSCTPDELAGPKVQKPRVSAVPATSLEDAAKPRQLRDRRAKAPGYPASTHSDELESVRSASRNSRRQTIADFGVVNSDPPEPTAHQRRASRRLSAGSNLSSIGGDLDPAPPPVPVAGSTANTTARRASGVMKPPPPPPPGVQVKKTRAPAMATTAASKVRKHTATNSAPVSPTRVKKEALSAPPPIASVGQGPIAADSSAMPTTNGTSELDTLTTGMKKITLKVGTKEEHDRKQKEKIDAERRARALKGAETRRVNAAAKKAAAAAGAATMTSTKSTASGVPKTSIGPASGVNTQSAISSAATLPTDVPMVSNATTSGPPSQGLWFAESSATNGTTHAVAPSSAGVFSQPQLQSGQYMAPPHPQAFAQMHETPSIPQFDPVTLPNDQLSHPYTALPQQYYASEVDVPTDGPTHDFNLPPLNSAMPHHFQQSTAAASHSPTPSFGYSYQPPPPVPVNTNAGQQLPVWSATGKIPFGAAINSEQNMSASDVNNKGKTQQISLDVLNGGEQHLNSTWQSKYEDGAMKGEASIWDVPETPRN